MGFSIELLRATGADDLTGKHVGKLSCYEMMMSRIRLFKNNLKCSSTRGPIDYKMILFPFYSEPVSVFVILRSRRNFDVIET